MSDLTIVYYTANRIPAEFSNAVRKNITEVSQGIPIISVSHHPISFGKNIVVEDEPSHVNIYRDALLGVKEATTKYVSLCEDDVLYSKEHFTYRPRSSVFGYDLAVWNIFTWGEPVFHRKETGRRNMYSLICERDIFIEAIEERFAKYPDDSKIDLGIWAEPSKYERQLGVTVRDWEAYYSSVPLIAFSHQTALSYKNLGTRKKQGHIKALDIPIWGKSENVIKLYK